MGFRLGKSGPRLVIDWRLVSSALLTHGGQAVNHPLRGLSGFKRDLDTSGQRFGGINRSSTVGASSVRRDGSLLRREGEFLITAHGVEGT